MLAVYVQGEALPTPPPINIKLKVKRVLLQNG